MNTSHGKTYHVTNLHKLRSLTPRNIVWAEEQYELLRKSQDDVKKIAHNTGLPESVVQQTKEHIFFNEHHLAFGLKRFDADPEIVATWDRLYQGDFIKNDISFLQHVYAEAILMQENNNIYEPFHDALEDAELEWDRPSLK